MLVSPTPPETSRHRTSALVSQALQDAHSLSSFRSADQGASPADSPALLRNLIQNIDACPNLADWSFESQTVLVFLQYRLGNQWARMTPFFVSRTPNNIKNQFFSVVRRCVRKCCRAVGEHAHLPLIGNLKSTTLSRFFAIFCDLVRHRRGCKEPENHIKMIMELAFVRASIANEASFSAFKEVIRETIATLLNFELANQNPNPPERQ